MEGIEPRHRKGCPVSGWAKCNCNPGVRASVWDPIAGKRKRRTFSDARPVKVRKQEAVSWQMDALRIVASGGTLFIEPETEATTATMAELWREFARMADRGVALNNDGKPFAASSLSRMGKAMAGLLREFGELPVGELDDDHLRGYKNDRLEAGKAGSTIRGEFAALRAMFSWAVEEKRVVRDPSRTVKLPAARKVRRRSFCTLAEAQALLTALEPADRVLWGLAFYTGLRRSEVLGLCWDTDAIDTESGLVTVLWTYLYEDRLWREQAKTTGSDMRVVPMMPQLRAVLEFAETQRAHTTVTVTGEDGRERDVEPILSELVTQSNSWSGVQSRADAAWKEAGLRRITLHECRHSFCSWLIAAAARAGETDVKALMKVTGHATYQMFIDTYGHLLPDSVDRVGAALTAFAEAG